MSDLKLLYLSGLILSLSACAVYGPVDDPARLQQWQVRQAAIQGLSVWRVDGRTAISSEQGSGKLALRWSQDGERFDIRLMSFLGQQQARLEGVNGGRTRLLRPDQPPIQADSEDAVMREELGWSLPLSGLRYWVLGMPQPGSDVHKAIDDRGRPVWLEQAGWLIEYASYQNVDGYSLPRKLRLKHGDLSARLVLDQWSLERGN